MAITVLLAVGFYVFTGEDFFKCFIVAHVIVITALIVTGIVEFIFWLIGKLK